VPDTPLPTAGRTVYPPPDSDPASSAASDQQQPGFFRKMWGAMWGN
jgi:hypothetical protein